MRGNQPFFDTNVLIYAFAKDDSRAEIAEALLARGGIIGVQTLNEFTAVAVRKLAMPWPDVLEALKAIRTLCPSPVPVTIETHDAALRIVARYGYRIYDALVIAAALQASCNTLYSEDMHDGQVIGRLTIRNPFAHGPNVTSSATTSPRRKSSERGAGRKRDIRTRHPDSDSARRARTAR